MRSLKYILLSLGLSFSVLAQNVSVTDYNVPVSSAKILRLSGNYNWAQSSTDSTTVVTANVASATSIFRYFYSSLPLAWFVDLDATGGKSYGNYTHDISLRPRIQKYLFDHQDFFGFVSLDARHTNTFRQIESFVKGGGGYGRFINATALAKAVRIEEHLLREKVISDHLPKETMLKIANIIEREDEYRGVHGDTYEKDWYEDIEKEIEESGYLVETGGLGAIGILRTQQVLKSINERVNERFYGWDVSLGVLFNLSTRDKSPTLTPALDLGGRFSYPMGWSSQIDMFANANTPLDSNFFKNVNSVLGLNYLYELSNRINFITGYRLNYYMPPVGDSYADHTVSTGFIFYLENQINLGINGSLVRNGLVNRTDLGTNVTLQYNFF